MNWSEFVHLVLLWWCLVIIGCRPYGGASCKRKFAKQRAQDEECIKTRLYRSTHAEVHYLHTFIRVERRLKRPAYTSNPSYPDSPMIYVDPSSVAWHEAILRTWWQKKTQVCGHVHFTERKQNPRQLFHKASPFVRTALVDSLLCKRLI